MKEKYIAKIAVFFAFIGLTLMYASSLYINLESADIGNIEKSWTGRNVKVSGDIESYSESGDHAFITLKDHTGNITVVNFDAQKSFSKGDAVNVTGNVEIYKGQLEIIADEIKIG